MKTLSEKSEKTLKVIHLISMSFWTVSLVIMFAIGLILPNAGTNEAFYLGHYINYIIDFLIVTPAAILTFLTGLIYSIFTKWKVPKNTWLKYKVAITLLLIVLGTFWLGPLLRELTEEVKVNGISLLSNENYLKNIKIVNWFSLTNALLLVIAYFLSTFKPGNQVE